MSLEGIDPNDKASIEWLNSQKKDTGTRKSYKTVWLLFLKFTGMTGDQILADRKNDTEHKWERKVTEFKDWVMQQPLQKQPNEYHSSYSATTAVMTARGFFAYWYVPLQYRPQEKGRLAKRHRKTEDYHFSLEDLKRMADCADLEDKYVLVAGKSFGLRPIDFIHLTRGNFTHIDTEPPIGIGPINTIKESVPAFPFIDTDAQPVIKKTLDFDFHEYFFRYYPKMTVRIYAEKDAKGKWILKPSQHWIIGTHGHVDKKHIISYNVAVDVDLRTIVEEELHAQIANLHETTTVAEVVKNIEEKNPNLKLEIEANLNRILSTEEKKFKELGNILRVEYASELRILENFVNKFEEEVIRATSINMPPDPATV